jgi:hypothetical protein
MNPAHSHDARRTLTPAPLSNGGGGIRTHGPPNGGQRFSRPRRSGRDAASQLELASGGMQGGMKISDSVGPTGRPRPRGASPSRDASFPPLRKRNRGWRRRLLSSEASVSRDRRGLLDLAHCDSAPTDARRSTNPRAPRLRGLPVSSCTPSPPRPVHRGACRRRRMYR